MRPASVAIILMFWIIYTGGGSCNRVDSLEDDIAAECRRQSIGTQAFKFCRVV